MFIRRNGCRKCRVLNLPATYPVVSIHNIEISKYPLNVGDRAGRIALAPALKAKKLVLENLSVFLVYPFG